MPVQPQLQETLKAVPQCFECMLTGFHKHRWVHYILLDQAQNGSDKVWDLACKMWGSEMSAGMRLSTWREGNGEERQGEEGWVGGGEGGKGGGRGPGGEGRELGSTWSISPDSVASVS